MVRSSRVAILIGGGLGLSACASRTNPPLLFGQAHTLGVAVSSTGPQGADFTLGFRDANIAFVPVTVTDATGTVHPIQSAVGPTDAKSYNALSVLGQFDVSTEADGTPKVGL